MNTIEDDPSATYLTNAVSNFGAAYAAMQETYATTMPPSMPCRGKSKCSATHLATSPLQTCHNTHSKPNRDVEHEAANVANNKTKANKDNPAAAVVAPTMVAGNTDSTEATAMVAEVTKAAG
jgi:hypothetical protein